jgi:hypothetical protein
LLQTRCCSQRSRHRRCSSTVHICGE